MFKKIIAMLTLSIMALTFGLTGCAKKETDISKLKARKGTMLEYTVRAMKGDNKTSYKVLWNGSVEITTPDVINGGEMNYTVELSDSNYKKIYDFTYDNKENDFGRFTEDGGKWKFTITGYDENGNSYDIFSGFQSSIEEINEIDSILSGYIIEGNILTAD